MSFTIYLAGGRSPWRDTLIKKWDKKYGDAVSCYDPFENSHQFSIADFTHDDLNAVGCSDLVFAYCDYHVYTGMALEFGYARALEIPIIFVIGPGMPRVDSMMVGVSKAAFTDFYTAVDFVEERHLDSLIEE